MMNAADPWAHRARRYVQQPAGYRAFVPAPLPPTPPLDLGGALRERLSAADYALGRLDGAVLTLPNPDLFVFMYVRKEAVLSSPIEGPHDWESWVTFFLRGVTDVSREATATAAALLRMREEYRARITEGRGRAAANGHRIMERLFDHPIVAVATVRAWLDVTAAGANNLVNRLVDVGLLREITGYARNRRFRFDPYLRLFEEPEEGRR